MEESLEDFRKRYKDTIVFLEIDSKKHIARYDGDNEVSLNFHSPIYGNILLEDSQAREALSFYFPENGLYNVDKKAVYFSRTPARQWKRAPCQDNCFLSDLLRSLGAREKPFIISCESMQQVFFPTYPKSLNDALEKLTYSTALTKEFAVSLGHLPDPNVFLFFYENIPIGTIHKESKEIHVEYKHLFQEVIDFCTKREPEWTPLLKNQQ